MATDTSLGPREDWSGNWGCRERCPKAWSLAKGKQPGEGFGLKVVPAPVTGMDVHDPTEPSRWALEINTFTSI